MRKLNDKDVETQKTDKCCAWESFTFREAKRILPPQKNPSRQSQKFTTIEHFSFSNQ